MAEYRVLVERYEQGWIYVEAYSPEEAETEAQEQLWDDEADVEWGSCGDYTQVCPDETEFIRPTGNESLWQ